MKESIKKIVSIFMAACMVLPNSTCYARNGKKHKKHSPVKLTETGLDTDEEKLYALRMDIYTVIRNEHPNYKGAVTRFEPLRSRCIGIEDDEELSDRLVEFFARFVESEGSANSIYDGIVLLLSIIDHFERGLFPENSNRDFCLWAAIFALNVCTFRNDILYNDWYKLLAPYIPPRFIKKFDRKRFQEQFSHIMTDADRLNKAARLISKLYSDSGVQRDGVDLITDRAFDRISPFLKIYTRARKAVKRLDLGNISAATVEEAEEAVTQYEKEISKYEHGMGETLVDSRSAIEAMWRSVRDSKAKLELMREGYSRARQVEYEFIQRMLLEKTPESVAAAEEACERYSRWLEENGDMLFVSSEMRMLKIDSDFKDLIKWFKYYIQVIKPRMDKLDYCIQALSTEFSDESYAEAMRAQEEFKTALSDYKTETSNQSVIMVDVENLTSLQALRNLIFRPPVTPEVAKELEELREYLAKNQSLISKIKQEYEVAEAVEKRNREYKKKTEDWNKSVADRKTLKHQEEQARRCSPESKDDSKKEEPAFELVFLHAPSDDEQYDPLEFFENNTQHIDEWNSWVEGALKGTPEGTTIIRNPSRPIYIQNGCTLNPSLKDGHPDVCEYRGGKALKFKNSGGFRILFYVEKDTKRVVVLYGGVLIGESHDNPWNPLVITADWIFEPIGKIEKNLLSVRLNLAFHNCYSIDDHLKFC